MGFQYLDIYKSAEKFVAISKRQGIVKRADFLSAADSSEADLVIFEILSKAPQSFLSSLDLDSLASLLNSALESLDDYSSNTHAFKLAQFQDRDCRFLVLAIKDQPFIINTLLNACQTLLIEAPIILHPVLNFRGQNISLSILYFDAISEECLQSLQARLELVLPALEVVCADFNNMNSASIDLWEQLKASNTPKSSEFADFVAWFAKGRFAFMGVAKYSENQSERNFKLGLFATNFATSEKLEQDIKEDYRLLNSEVSFNITRLSCISPVHYRRRLLHLAFSLNEGKQFYSFIGLWTSRALLEEAGNAPIIRNKVKEILSTFDLAEQSHDQKWLIRAINITPRYNLLSYRLEEMRTELDMLRQVDFSGKTQARLKVDSNNRGILATFILKTENFHVELRDLICTELGLFCGCRKNHVDFFLTSLNEDSCRSYFYAPFADENGINKSDAEGLQILTDKLLDLTLGWRGHFELLLQDIYGTSANKVFSNYKSVLTPRYQALTSPAEALLDLQMCESVSEISPVRIRLDRPIESEEQQSFGSVDPTLTIAKLGSQFKLSKVLPILENLNFIVVDSETIELKLPNVQESIFLHRFILENNLPNNFDIDNFETVSAPSIEQILEEKQENDSLNSLLVVANLDIQAIVALRVLCNCLWQMRKLASRLAIRAGLTNNPNCSRLLWRMFQVKFDPDLDIDPLERRTIVDQIHEDFQSELKSVKDIAEDALLKALAQIILHSLRTNFFLGLENVAIKIRSEALPILRGTKPLYETYIYGPKLEGVHLRSSKVSRGGIRWSDRREDYRSEVLGLMRVQRIKNALAVPSGAKGGFIIKDGAKLVTIREEVIKGYKNYIRALLSLADNIVAGEVVSPQNIVIHDEADPYLVVAADKGTAAFSDYANEVASQEFNFWLGDGFASGGSRGYSHKELGITARGAWECAKRHFIEQGIDFESHSFRVVGIGDMSGDVFGNGLIQTKNMSLIAAFDHRHIFVDPNPNLERSFEERIRLFNLPKSSWLDFNAEIISEGGGVFDRMSKEIHLTELARQALGISTEDLGPYSGEQLIYRIMKAPVELLWNGGIGTYVKASFEVDSEVNDSSNDGVRINAADLRAKIVAEGGNLGLTQAARVEYALRGGRINTDAVDNSAGVDLSDHEVNLKILFQTLKEKGLATTEERDLLLKQIGQEVSDAVLTHNRNQSFVISVAQKGSKKSLDYFKALIRELSDRSYINRVNDGLPSDDELEKRSLKRSGLTRPELSIFMAGVKLWVKDELIRSEIAKDHCLREFGLSYFPKYLQERFSTQILQHPLIENITCSEIANHLLDVVGITFLHRLNLSEGVSFSGAVKASIAACLVLKTPEFLDKLSDLDNFKLRQEHTEARLDLGRASRVIATQFVQRFGAELDIEECVKLYSPDFDELLKNPIQSLGFGAIRDSFEASSSKRLASGLDAQLSSSLSFFHLAWLAIDASDLSTKSGLNVALCHSLLVRVWEEFQLEFLILGSDLVNARNKWEHELLMGTYDRLRTSIAKITALLLQDGESQKTEAEFSNKLKTLRTSSNFAMVELLVAEYKNSPDVAVLYALARHLKNFSLIAQ